MWLNLSEILCYLLQVVLSGIRTIQEKNIQTIMEMGRQQTRDFMN